MEVAVSSDSNNLAVNGSGAVAGIPVDVTSDDLIHQALFSKDVDIERFERLLDFQERILNKKA